MVEAALEALVALFQPMNLLFLMVGVLVGLTVGIIPGLSGTVGLAILLPLVFGMEPTAAIAMMIGLLAVTQTSDTFPAVLLGVPGTSGGASTILDGHPMAKKGQASRALGAAFSASMFGGIIGAIALFAILPIARPLILSVGAPELFMLAIFGLSMVAILSRGRSPLAGLLMAAFGLAVSTIGAAPATPEYRYAFDQVYLYDGLPLVIIVLGLFAIPELIELLRRDRTIAGLSKITGGRFDGVRDTLRNKALVFRSAVIGIVLGAIPGVGGSAVTWILYGLTRQFSRDKSQFGKGDVRGVIGPESGNNSNESGALMPTLLFGVPGSGSMAVLLGGFILLGLQPGPQLIEEELPLVMTVAWSLALANILGTVICFALRNQVARIATIRPEVLVPALFIAITLAAFQSRAHWGDFALLLLFGVFGWVCVRAGWPRAPFLIGFVLGAVTERYLWISLSLYDTAFLLRPGVIGIGVVTLIVIALGFLPDVRKRGKKLIERGVKKVAPPETGIIPVVDQTEKSGAQPAPAVSTDDAQRPETKDENK